MMSIATTIRKQDGARSAAALLRTVAAAMAIILLPAALAQTAPVTPVQPTSADTAMVRFVNLAPNASPVTVALSNEDGAVIALDELVSVPYGAATAYLPLPAGDYEMTVTVGDANTPLPPGFTAPYSAVDPNGLAVSGARHYTVVMLGLLVPETFEDGATDEGFFGWLSNLFSGDDPVNRDALALRVEVLDDDLDATFDADQARVRFVHAAPGAAAVDLVAAGDRGVVDGGVNFGNVSGYHTLAAGETNLALRGAGSDAELVDLTGQAFGTGTNHTVFLIGTPFEGVPLDTIVLSDPPTAAQ